MKGKQTVHLKGKDIELSFTVGAMEDFQEYLKSEGVEGGLDDAISEMKYFRKLIEILTDYAGNKVDASEFKYLEFSEISKVTQLMTSATENITVGNEQKAKGK
jgi:deoxyribodipyrimidine photolyase-like uncharacterized protein